jgi:hypothetical protein
MSSLYRASTLGQTLFDSLAVLQTDGIITDEEKRLLARFFDEEFNQALLQLQEDQKTLNKNKATIEVNTLHSKQK